MLYRPSYLASEKAVGQSLGSTTEINNVLDYSFLGKYCNETENQLLVKTQESGLLFRLPHCRHPQSGTTFGATATVLRQTALARGNLRIWVKHTHVNYDRAFSSRSECTRFGTPRLPAMKNDSLRNLRLLAEMIMQEPDLETVGLYQGSLYEPTILGLQGQGFLIGFLHSVRFNSKESKDNPF